MRKSTTAILILGLALMLRLVFLSESLLRNPTFFAPIIDAHTYTRLALAEASGAGMGPESVWQALFYPYFLSACYRIFGYGYVSARVVQIILGLLTCILTYWLGRKLFGENTGLAAAFLVAVSGPLIFYEGELLPATWEVFWFLLSVAAFVMTAPGCRMDGESGGISVPSDGGEGKPFSPLGRGRDGGGIKGGRASFLTLGIVCAVGVMIRANSILFYLASWAWLLAQCRPRSSWKKILPRTACAAVGASLVFGPVLMRNHALTQRWILLPLSGGLNFYIGNNPEADTTVAIRPGDQWYQMTVSPRKEGILHAPEGPEYFYRKSYEFIRRHPGAFLKGLTVKAGLLFSAREIPRNIDVYLFRKYSHVLGMLVWRIGGFGFPMGIIFPLALFGAAVNLSHFRRTAYLYLFVVSYSIPIILFFVSGRYRLPLLPALCLFAACGICCLCGKCARKDYAGVTWSLAFLAVAFAFCNRALTIPEDAVNFESELYMALGTVHLGRGEGRQGDYYLGKSVYSDPRNADAHNLLGLRMLQKGELDRAGGEWMRALDLRPTHVGALRNLGQLYRRTKELDRARDCFLRAATLDPGSEEIHRDLAGVHEDSGNIHEAAWEYWKALELKPDSVATRRDLSVVLGKMGRWDAARELIAEAVRHEPDNADLRCDLGSILVGMGRPQEAVEEFRKALKTRPDFPMALLNLGIVYARTGDRANADVQYRALKPLDGGLARKLEEELRRYSN